MRFTIIIMRRGVEGAALGVHPRLHTHKVRYEGGNLTLYDGRVAADHVFVVRLDLVALRNHCEGRRREGKAT